QIAQAPEQIDLERGQADACLEGVAHGVAALRAQVGRHALARAFAAQPDAGPLGPALHAVLGPGLFHALDGDTKVAVVDQRELDEGLQARIAEELAPAYIGGGHGAGRRHGLRGLLRQGRGPVIAAVLHLGLRRPVAGHRRRGAVVIGGQRASGQYRDQARRQGGSFMDQGCHCLPSWPGAASGPWPDCSDCASRARLAACSASNSLSSLPSRRGLVLNRLSTTTKKVGTKMTANGVAASMPPSTPMPTARWLAAPAPVAIASGTTPRMNASEVMRMG